MREAYTFFYYNDANIKLTQNFKVKEFKSRDYPVVIIDKELLNVLQTVRNGIGAPININSGFRSKEHNDSVGGSKNSAHLIGAGADIWTPKMSVLNFAEYLRVAWGNKIAIGAHSESGYVHIDVVYRGNHYLGKLSNKVTKFK